MFKYLFKLEYKRSKSEAFGFYLVYSIIMILIAAFTNGIVANFIYPDVKTINEGLQTGLKVGKIVVPIVAIAMSSALSVGIIVSKKLKDVGAIILALFAILVTPALGVFIGNIFIAILTTYDNKNVSIENEKTVDIGQQK